MDTEIHHAGSHPYGGGILGVPDEILLQIMHCLEFQDIITLGKTCKRLHDPTQDRSIWLHLLRQQQKRLPFPHHISEPSKWAHLSTSSLTSVVRRLRVVEHTWLSERTHYFVPGHRMSCSLDPIFDNDDGARSIYTVEIYLDRWLLCVYHEKIVELWDLDSVLHDPHKPIVCTSQNVRGTGSFSSASTHLDEENSILTIAVSCHELCQVLQVQLRPSSAFYALEEDEDLNDVCFRTIAVIPIPSPVLCLRAVVPARSLLLLSLPSSFHLLNWETGQRTIVHMMSEEEEELWNGVVGATFLTSQHVLVIKSHSIEICTLVDNYHDAPQHPQSYPSESTRHPNRPPESHMYAMVHSHYLHSTTFRGVSFAHPVVHRLTPHAGSASLEPGPTKVSTSFLAFDVLRGLFHFSVTITLPPAAPSGANPEHTAPTPIDVHVQLLSSHNMAMPIALAIPDDGTSTPTGGSAGALPRSGFSHGTRGFVSSCALGPTGRRGVWVERRRGAVRRVVYAFDAASSSAAAGTMEELTGEPMDTAEDVDGHSDREGSHTSSSAPTVDGPPWRGEAINGREVYEVNSYDLRDDITHIAFAEATGLIALGTRKGDIRVLGRAGVY
ncbi:hypothetical protein BD413DRAFT_569414 [Trametes elegans]|nr:hypothetical protein BD413DRAFT_569414 [Trametes elegans]